jgi:hypothetical protein
MLERSAGANCEMGPPKLSVISSTELSEAMAE